MRKIRSNKITPAEDGEIRLPVPARNQIEPDRQIEVLQEQQRNWMRELRGSILTDCFTLENELILLGLADEFGHNAPGAGVAKYFDREQAWREEPNLGALIERIRPIIRRRRPKEFTDRLSMSLADCNNLRNLLARYPCWLEPAAEGHGGKFSGLKLKIADRTHVWELNNQQAQAWRGVLAHAVKAIGNIRREVLDEHQSRKTKPVEA